jgi:hypothetical protein
MANTDAGADANADADADAGDAADPDADGGGERLLTLVGIGLALALVVGVGIALLAAASGSGGSADVPDATWTLTTVNDTHVRITHTGGQPVAAAELIVTVDGYERKTTWEGEIAEGDATVVRARQDQLVRLYWDGGRTDRAQLGRWRVG